jgi:DNA (cytosine-5)-methyltransferase 1
LRRTAAKELNIPSLFRRALRRSGKDFKGYEVYGELIDFSEFGIPQKRTRFILVGIKKGHF